MNIAFVVYSHYSRDARVRRYTESLAKKGFNVDVISLAEHYQPKEKNISLIKYPFGRKRLGKYWYIFEYFLFFFYSFFILSARYLFRKYKFVHINNMPDFLVFTAIIPKFFGAKIILDLHDPMPELYMSKYHVGENDWMVKRLKSLENISIKFSDRVITANPIFKEIFLSRNNIPTDKITVILNCPDARIFQPLKSKKSNNKYFNLFYMGTVEERFGLDTAIDALTILVNKIPNLRFIVIPKLEDEGKYSVELKNKIRRLKLEKYISFHSPIPLEHLIKKISSANIGIVLAKDGIFTDSIIPVKLLEFIQMGIPVIATETRSLRRYFSNEQICFVKNSAEDFLKAVLKLYANPTLGKVFALKAKNYLKKNNWRNEQRKYFAIIESLDIL